MAYSEGQLNGAADYRVGIDVWYSGVQSGNSSRFDWNVRIVGTYGSWTNATCEWWASIGGNPYYGTFTLPSGWGSPRIVGSGSTWIGHDSNGFRPGFANNAYMKVPHSNIGEGGSGDVWVDAPRIPKAPAAPGALSFSNVTTTNVRVTAPSPDNMGSPITGYDFQRARDASFTVDAATVAHNGRVLDMGGLTPGQTYYFRVRAKNAVGTGGWSPTGSQKTQTALYFLDPANPTAAPEPVVLYAWNGSTYELVDLLIDPELDGTFTYPVA